MSYLEKYNFWLQSKFLDENSKLELKNLKDKKEIEDRFYKDLEFGTGGLRGVIGIGSNRMNIYTVGKATQGLAEYLTEKYKEGISVAIAYDSRMMSKEFAEMASKIFCGNGIKVYMYESLRPTPMLSYAVSYLNCKAGIVITASHNPKEYNGYKVYGEDGGQITDRKAEEIITYVNGVLDFSEVKTMDLNKAMEEKLFEFIGEEVDKTYYEKVKKLTIRKELVSNKSKTLNIVYTPLHGTGNLPIRRILSEMGYLKLFIPKEQELPDGKFPTVKYPNPEESQVFSLALDMAKDTNPDIIFGTDPDCDRIGVVIKDDHIKDYRVLTGNQMGVLLTNYIITSLIEEGKLLKNSTIVKTIVTTDMAKKIAEGYGVKVIEVLTGFKYIGEKIQEFKEKNNSNFIFGFEESYGYLAGTFVRDKDAVITAMLICEMALYYKDKGITLYDALIELYEKYGFYKEKLISIELKGKTGGKTIRNCLEHLRHSMEYSLGNKKIVKKMDYKIGIEKDLIQFTEEKIGLPKSNVLKFILEDGSWFVVRPSGTEPKMKIYLSVVGESIEGANIKINEFEKNVMSIINKACNYN